MRILVLHNKIKPGSYADFLFQLLTELLTGQNYTIIKTSGFSEAKQINPETKKTVVVIHFNKAKSSIFSKLKLQAVIKKHAIQWLVQITDSRIISSRLPQLIISNHTEKVIPDKALSSLSFAVCSRSEKQKTAESHDLRDAAIQIIPSAADKAFQPVSWSEQQSVKMRYTQGREYFLVNAQGKTFDSFTSLLKAFSAFKKWQHSSMKLVVSGKFSFTHTTEWNEKINTYKYRDDVMILEELNDEEHIVLLASAYTFIHTPAEDNNIIPLLRAMQCGTPAISFHTDSIEEYTDDAAILTEQNNYEQLAEKMILLYKDETLRSRMIERGKEQALHYSKEKALTALMSALPSNLH